MKIKLPIINIVLIITLLLSGCSSGKELQQFHDEFDRFCNDVADIDNSINSLDASSESAPDQLLKLLDELELKFQELANMKIPSDFSYMDNLAKEASENMSMAVENFHKAYESETYDYESAALAEQYMSRAHKRIQYMISFLHGETPDDTGITVE